MKQPLAGRGYGVGNEGRYCSVRKICGVFLWIQHRPNKKKRLCNADAGSLVRILVPFRLDANESDIALASDSDASQPKTLCLWPYLSRTQ